MNPKTCQAGISQVITSAASDRDSHVKFSAVNDHLSADDVNDHILHTHTYLRAAAPAADPGKEKLAMVSAGFIRVFCELSAWMLYIYIIYIYICIK